MEIPIIDDEMIEADERFRGYIEVVDAVDRGNIVVGRNFTTLGVLNDDGKND